MEVQHSGLTTAGSGITQKGYYGSSVVAGFGNAVAVQKFWIRKFSDSTLNVQTYMLGFMQGILKVQIYMLSFMQGILKVQIYMLSFMQGILMVQIYMLSFMQGILKVQVYMQSFMQGILKGLQRILSLQNQYILRSSIYNNQYLFKW